MRLYRRKATGFGFHTILDILLIVLGITLFAGIVPLPEINFFYSVVLAIVGVLMIAVPFGFTSRIGFALLLLGTYIACRHVGFISVEYLRYILACFLLLIGCVGIARDATSVPETTDIEQDENDNE